ncbi:hypothetical protein KC368_g68 [Hortaea werneckii]|nr:hypothetical protein KC368_g68 [Hortaea werneckii]
MDGGPVPPPTEGGEGLHFGGRAGARREVFVRVVATVVVSIEGVTTSTIQAAGVLLIAVRVVDNLLSTTTLTTTLGIFEVDDGGAVSSTRCQGGGERTRLVVMAAADFACRVDGETRIDIFDVSVRAGAKWRIVELGILIEGVSSSSGHSMVDLIAHAAYRPCPCHQHRCFASLPLVLCGRRRAVTLIHLNCLANGPSHTGVMMHCGPLARVGHRGALHRRWRAILAVRRRGRIVAEVDRILHDLPANLEVRTRRVVDRSRLWVARNLSAEVHIRALCLRNPEAEGGRLICWSQLSLGIRDVSVLEVELPEGSGFHIGLD